MTYIKPANADNIPLAMHINIEPAVPADIPRIRELMELSMECIQDPDWFVDDDVECIERHICQPRYGYILKYLLEGRFVGYLMVHKPGSDKDNLAAHLNLPKEEYSSVVHIESVCVDPSCRGMGIFRSLMHAAVEKERMDPSTRYLMGTVHPENSFSKNVFLVENFQVLETTFKYGGKLRDILYLRLR